MTDKKDTLKNLLDAANVFVRANLEDEENANIIEIKIRVKVKAYPEGKMKNYIRSVNLMSDDVRVSIECLDLLGDLFGGSKWI